MIPDGDSELEALLREQLELRAQRRERGADLVCCIGSEAMRLLEQRLQALRHVAESRADGLHFLVVACGAELERRRRVRPPRRERARQRLERFHCPTREPDAREHARPRAEN